MTITDRWEPNKLYEAKMTFGADDNHHPAVNYLHNSAGKIYLGGPVTGIQPPVHYDFRGRRNTPNELRSYFRKMGWRKIVAFQTRNPLHRAHQELTFPVISPDPEKNSNVKYLTYPIYAGGNRGRGQVYPTGEKSNVNVFGATQTGQITEITTVEKGESNITIVNVNGTKTSQLVPAGLKLIVKTGDIVKIDQALNIDPNAGGFGQEESEIVLQNPLRIIGYLAFCFCVLLTQVFLILKKKQFEKVQAAELNF